MFRSPIDRPRWALPTVPLLATLAVLLVGCNQVGTSSLTFWDIVWSMVFFFFWVAFIWIFITLFADIFRRDDLSGIAKASWLILLIVLPFLGSLIYIIARPKVTPGDVRRMTQMDAGMHAATAVSPTDQIAKLQELRAAGAITQDEFKTLKSQALG
jgi:predicted membrane channel-forming protein YqfA (hemolysin III family)